MKDHSTAENRTIELKVDAGCVKLRFSNEESRNIRDTIMEILTSSYERRIQAQITQLCKSLEPEIAS